MCCYSQVFWLSESMYNSIQLRFEVLFKQIFLFLFSKQILTILYGYYNHYCKLNAVQQVIDCLLSCGNLHFQLQLCVHSSLKKQDDVKLMNLCDHQYEGSLSLTIGAILLYLLYILTQLRHSLAGSLPFSSYILSCKGIIIS